MPRRGNGFVAPAKQSNLIANTRVADFRDANPGIDDVRELERSVILATGLDDETDHVAGFVVQNALTEQILVHNGIEVRVIVDVVDMLIDVVVHPARRYFEKVLVVGSDFLFRRHATHSTLMT